MDGGFLLVVTQFKIEFVQRKGASALIQQVLRYAQGNVAISVMPDDAGCRLHCPPSASTHAEITVVPMPGCSDSPCIPTPLSLKTKVTSLRDVRVSWIKHSEARP